MHIKGKCELRAHRPWCWGLRVKMSPCLAVSWRHNVGDLREITWGEGWGPVGQAQSLDGIYPPGHRLLLLRAEHSEERSGIIGTRPDVGSSDGG